MSYYCTSLIGKRDSNEDKHVVFENENNKYIDKNKINYYAVYDGHGGKEISSFLAKELHQYFLIPNIDYDNLKNLKKYIKNVFEYVQKKLDITYRNKAYNTGSTALIIIIYKDNNNNKHLYIINLGDCRSILCNQYDKPIQLSEDHKPNSETEKNRINKLGGNIYFDGYDFRVESLSVSRAFGDIDTKPYISHIPEIYKLKLNKKDKFIVLACDGLWDVMTNEEVVDFIKNNHKDNRCNISKKLAEYAINKGSTDNISIVIKFL